MFALNTRPNNDPIPAWRRVMFILAAAALLYYLISPYAMLVWWLLFG